jgi:Flp pilus assembly protein TadD
VNLHSHREAGGASKEASPASRLPVAIAALAAMTAFVYRDVGSFPFSIFDDVPNLVRNPVLQGGLSVSSVRWAFTSFADIGWLPLTWLSHLLDVSLFGMAPGSHHLVNLSIHLANTILLFLRFRKMTGRSRESWIVAALFAVHPLHVESVAWISERKDVLSGFFSLLAIGAYLRYVERPGAGRYAGLALCFALALLSKSMAVTMPFLLLLLDFWPLERVALPGDPEGEGAPVRRRSPLRTLCLEKLPLLALSAAVCVVTWIAQQRINAVRTLDDLPLWQRAGNALNAYVAYLRKTAWPSDLAVYYPHPGKALSVPGALASALLLCAVTWLALRQLRARRWVAFGWFWFLGALVPVIGLVQVGSQALADRYSYVPLIGIFTVAAWGLCELSDRVPVPGWGKAAILAGCLGSLMVAAHVQAGYWRDSAELFRRDIEVAGDNFLARMNLGGALSAAGKDEEALVQYRRSLELRPGWAEAEYAAYATLTRLGRKDEAESQFGKALERSMRDPVSANNVGLALAGTGKLREAEAAFKEAVRLRPDFAEAHYNLGVALGRQGRKEEALPHFRAALDMPPADAEAVNRIGVALMRLDRSPEAVAKFRKALSLRPGYGEARFNLAVALERSGNRGEAREMFEAILRDDPRDQDAAEGLRRVSGTAAPR